MQKMIQYLKGTKSRGMKGGGRLVEVQYGGALNLPDDGV